MDLNEKEKFFFDLDKTLWNWNSTVIGAEDTVESLREVGKDVYFHTDNTLLSREKYAEKLSTLGIPADKEDVFTAGYAAAKTLGERDINKVYVIGESGLINELEDNDIQVTADAENVLVGFDRQFSYNKLKRAMEILVNDGNLFICSTEKTFRKTSTTDPHQGITNQTLEEFAEPKIIGKPSKQFRKHFKDYFSYFPGKSVFIGDRHEDMEAGNKLGMTTLGVMSGDMTRKSISEAEEIRKPDFGLSSLVKLKRRVL